MKIDLDLDEIFDEEGSVEDSIKERIIQTVVQRIYTKIDRNLSEKINKILEDEIKEKVNATLSSIIPALLDYEFIPVSSYGQKGSPTTVRNQIAEQIRKECVIVNRSYSLDQNIFTRVFHSGLEELKKEIVSKLQKEIQGRFTAEVIAKAEEALCARLNIDVVK